MTIDIASSISEMNDALKNKDAKTRPQKSLTRQIFEQLDGIENLIREGYKISDIAKNIGLTEHQFQSALYRARQQRLKKSNVLIDKPSYSSSTKKRKIGIGSGLEGMSSKTTELNTL